MLRGKEVKTLGGKHTIEVKDVGRRSVKGKTSSGQARQIDRFTLKPGSLASVKANCRKITVRQGVKVPSPDIFRRGAPGGFLGLLPGAGSIITRKKKNNFGKKIKSVSQ